eukprot:TRINITY_DN8479_c0_g1_i2.p1 TRINITY_DN8479_c0_g1~~TRINITY_DN8479_c0_g1_i2.p1  ORF type:complete len:103 (+),score=20.82 TRINITY_DN8479_c0_g1_i2:66-374(+)
MLMFGGMSDNKKIGIGLTLSGCLFTFLGVVLFFDSLLLTMGNILFLAGVALAIGARKAAAFFLPMAEVEGHCDIFWWHCSCSVWLGCDWNPGAGFWVHQSFR